MSNLVYIRYIPTKDGNEPKKLKEIEKNCRKYGEIIKIPVKNTKKLSNKEIEQIGEIVTSKGITNLYIYYVQNDEQFQKLKDKLSINIEIIDEKIDETNTKSISKKLLVLIDVLKFIAKKKKVFYDELYKKIEELNYFHKTTTKKVSKVTIRNYLKELEELYFIEKDSKFYKIKDNESIIKEVFEKVDDVELITQILASMGDEEMRNLSQTTQKLLKSNREFVIYKQRPFEDLEEVSFEFTQLKAALKSKKIISFIEKGNHKIDENIIPISLVFMENNWYLAGLLNEDIRMYRLSFIWEFAVSKDTHNKNLTKYIQFIKDEMKTPFTKYNRTFKVAKIEIDKSYKHYFDIKEHFPYQKVLKDEKDQNLIMEIRYTQPLEVLPTIKKWLPNIRILESENNELQTILIEELKTNLNFYVDKNEIKI